MAVATLVLFFLALFGFYGRVPTWQVCCVPALPTAFYDTFALGRASETFALGGDPLIITPAIPNQIPINYPALNWQIFHLLGIDSSHTFGVAISFILLFLSGVCLILPDIKNGTLALVLLALASPATLLCIERGNTDLLLFFLVALSLVAMRKTPFVSVAITGLGFLLKLFPVFSYAVLIRLAPKRFIRYFLFLGLSLSLYAVATASDLTKILSNTPQGINGSYGFKVLSMGVASVAPEFGTIARTISYLLLLLVIAFATTALLKNEVSDMDLGNTLNGDAFRAGASIYTGTFLLGTNFDYKLIFLIFTIPQLVCWSQKPSTRKATLALTTLVLLFVSLFYWGLMIRVAPYLPIGKHLVFLFDEICNWCLFALLAYFLVWSMPEWIRRLASFRTVTSAS